jgi:hypothetical protein
MAQALLGRDREQEEEWGVVWGEGWEGWVETALGRAPAGIVCVLAVGQGFLTKQVLPAMI